MEQDELYVMGEELLSAVKGYRDLIHLRRRMAHEFALDLSESPGLDEAEHRLWQVVVRVFEDLTLARGGQ